AGVGAAVVAFAARHRIPVLLTPMAKGLIAEDHPCYAGVVFHALSDLVGETHRQADLVVAVGYDPVEFNFESWLPDAPVVCIDSRKADSDRKAYRTTDVVGDIAAAVRRLAKLKVGAKDWDMAALARRREAMFE